MCIRDRHEAFHVASNGRPGPVVIDIPKDIQFASGSYTRPRDNQHKTYRPVVKGDLNKIKAAVELIAGAKRPVFYTGGGVINSGPHASVLLRELARLTGFPVTSTLMGLGAFPAADKQWLGMLGMHGTYEEMCIRDRSSTVVPVMPGTVRARRASRASPTSAWPWADTSVATSM